MSNTNPSQVALFSTAALQDKVDRLGVIKASIADLEAQEKEIVDDLKARGAGTYIGQFYEAVVFEQLREATAWKEIAEAVGYSRQLKTAHTKQQEVIVCKVTSRK